MTNLKRLILLFFLFLSSIVSNGQIDKISPCYDFSDQIPQKKEYNKNLERVFISNFNHDFLIRFIAKPSFDPEYAFQIYHVDDSAFMIEAFEMKANLWYTKRSDSVNSFSRDIDIKLKQEIVSLFSIIIDSQGKYLFGSQEDGEQYNFLVNACKGLRCAQVESADANSVLSEVIEIMDDLMQYAKDKDSNASPIEERIKSLCLRIECY